MAQQLVERRRIDPARAGPGQPGRPGSGGGGSRGERSRPGGVPRASAGVWLLLAAVGMLFLGFTSSYLARRTGADWTTVGMPRILWATTTLLVASSALLEWGRLGRRQGRAGRLAFGLTGAAALGLLFVAGQVTAWRELAAAGLFLASNPHASFFYLLTAVHGAHALAGLIWLFLAAARVRAGRPHADEAARAVAIYWHFVGVLWIYLWILLFWT